MQWLKVILIVLMVVAVPIKTTASVDTIYEKPLIILDNEELKEGKLRYAESKAILAKTYYLLNELNDTILSLEEMILDKNREDEDFYVMLVTTHEVRDILYLLDHCVTISVNLIHIKTNNYNLFLEFGLKKINKMMSLVDMGKTTLRVNFNFIRNKKFIEETKKVLEITIKIQKAEVAFFEKLLQ